MYRAGHGHASALQIHILLANHCPNKSESVYMRCEHQNRVIQM